MENARSVPRTSILVAAGPEIEERARRVLTGHDLVPVRTLREATDFLARQEFGLVIADVDFDESQMFELLHHVRINRQDANVPIACILGGKRERRMSKVLVESLNYAVRAMTANAFLDFARMPDDEAGNARLRKIIDYLILIDGELHQGLEQD